MAKRIGTADIITAGMRWSVGRVAQEFRGPFYSLSRKFTGNRLKSLKMNVCPPVFDFADPVQGVRILDGRFVLGSQSLDVGTQGDPWSIASPSPRYAERLHGFSWLKNMAALATSKPHLAKNKGLAEKTARRAQHLVDRWIAHFGDYNPFAWREDILAERVFNWLSVWQNLLQASSEEPANQAADQAADQKRQNTLYRQINYLRKRLKSVPAGLPRLKAAACLVMGRVCFDGQPTPLLDKALDQLEDEIIAQILPDGGHISRSPEAVAEALEILLMTDKVLETGGVSHSREIRRGIDRLAPMLNFFLRGDGRVFSFHGGSPGQAKRMKGLVRLADVKSKTFGYAPHSKYQRLERNGTVVMLDTGDAAPNPFDREAHLSPLAFELTTLYGPLIVNCGWNAEQPSRWRDVVRKTAAHSTLVLNGQDTGRIAESGVIKKWLGPIMIEGVGAVGGKRLEQEAGTWLETWHDGYLDTYGLRHIRRLYMNVEGTDLRCEDQLLVPPGHTPLRQDLIPFAIRFHLHPEVKVTLARDKKSALLIQNGKRGWHFRTDGNDLRLDPSVYLAEGARPVRCQQLVIYGAAYADSDGQVRSNRVRWTLKRLAAMQEAKSRSS